MYSYGRYTIVNIFYKFEVITWPNSNVDVSKMWQTYVITYMEVKVFFFFFFGLPNRGGNKLIKILYT